MIWLGWPDHVGLCRYTASAIRAMRCPKCQSPRAEQQSTCSACGIVFHKYDAYLASRELMAEQSPRSGPGIGAWLKAQSQGLLVPPRGMPDYFGGYAILWTAFVAWGFRYLTGSMESLGHNFYFMHQVNLPFHEAGHVLFGVFGQFIGSLGGTLGQLIIPVICGAALLKTRADTFGASLCLWWFGENFLDIAPYMADARAGELLLLGGNYGSSSPYGFHDWEFILGETGLLAYDQVLAAITLNMGRLIMLIAMVWGGYLLWKSRREQAA